MQHCRSADGLSGKPGSAMWASSTQRASLDGWAPVTGAAFSARGGHSATAWDQQVVVIGGSDECVARVALRRGHAASCCLCVHAALPL
jgi:hypothetical protein